ncbi:MAG: helix-turn-helix domain-containing protein [Defluviitaleaceae bacterium]|nr:helix-turn-helix domain-containing protein [Defluviitaleaceae bacterium]
MNMQDIGLRISELRKQRDMTQLELADKMGVSYQAVSSWERGSTMPDISRLPEISQILEVSIDQLLGNGAQTEIVKNILNQQTDVYTDESKPQIQDIAEIAHMLKPSQIDQLVERADPKGISIGELVGFAPFISKEALSQLAMKAEDAGDISGLCSIAPFLDRKTLDRIAMNVYNIGDIGNLCSLAPFLSKEVLNELALKINEIEGIGALSGIAPFISKKTLGQLAMKAIDSGDIHELYGIAPFLDKELLSELILKASAGN